MSLLALKVVVGFVVGTLVGISGLGGGVVLLPVLIFILRVPPIVAVGSDAAFNFLTKIGAVFHHSRRRTIEWSLVRALAMGSIPGAYGGVSLLAWLREVYGGGVNSVLRIIIGLLLILIPILYLSERYFQRWFFGLTRSDEISLRRGCMIGLLAGFLVGMSSVGSGSIVMILLMIFIRRSPTILIGTDIAHALVLTGFTSLLHIRLGNVDPGLVIPLLVGSVPGALLGVQGSQLLPSRWIKGAVCLLLLATGAKMMWT